LIKFTDQNSISMTIKNHITSFLSILVITSLLISCNSGKKDLKQGNYYSAVMKSVKKLRSHPNNKKSRETLLNGYPMSVDWFLDQSNNMLASSNPYKWKAVLTSYERINNMYEEIRKSPGALQVIPNPKNYYSELVDARQKAAEESYALGEKALNQKTREAAKQAYFNFRDVNRFVPGYKDVHKKIDEAKFYATLKVIVEQIPVPSLSYQVSANFFQDKIEEYLHSYNKNEFVRFYSPKEAETENLKYPDQILRLQFRDFVVGQTHVKERIETIERDSVKVGEVKVADSSIVVYSTVKAKLTTFRKEVISNGILNFIVMDANNKSVLTSENMGGEFVWFSEWGNFNGDERALTKEQLKIARSREIPPPNPQDLFVLFTEPIYDQLTRKVRYFYDRY